MEGAWRGGGGEITIHYSMFLYQYILLSDGTVSTINTLGTKDARQKWEALFDQLYIQPVLTNLDRNLTEAMDLVASDDQQGIPNLNTVH